MKYSSNNRNNNNNNNNNNIYILLENCNFKISARNFLFSLSKQVEKGLILCRCVVNSGSGWNKSAWSYWKSGTTFTLFRSQIIDQLCAETRRDKW